MTREIMLTQGKVAIVDDDDYEWLSQWKWHYHNKGYASGKVGDKIVMMHRKIINCSEDMVVDHINGNKLDNRRKNLRECSQSNNVKNARSHNNNKKSKYKGLTLSKNNIWIARIQGDNIRIEIGRFTNEIAAANAYNYYAPIYHGEFALLNEIEFMDKSEWEKYMNRSTSKYVGIDLMKKGKWRCRVNSIHVGLFETEELAVLAYNEYIIKNNLKKSLQIWRGDIE